MRESADLLDPGAQAERTALAWQRTGLALLGVGAVLLHVDGRSSSHLSLAVGLLDIVAGAVLGAVVAPLRYRRTLRSVEEGTSLFARRSCLATASCAVVSCLAAGAGLLQAL